MSKGDWYVWIVLILLNCTLLMQDCRIRQVDNYIGNVESARRASALQSSIDFAKLNARIEALEHAAPAEPSQGEGDCTLLGAAPSNPPSREGD